MDAIEAYLGGNSGTQGYCRNRIAHILLALFQICLGVTFFCIPYTPPSFGLFLFVQMVGSVFSSFVNVYGTTLAIRVGAHAEAMMKATDSGQEVEVSGAFAGACVSIVHVGVGMGGVIAPLVANFSQDKGNSRIDAYKWILPYAMVLACLIAFIAPPPRLSSGLGSEGNFQNSVVGQVNEGSVIASFAADVTHDTPAHARVLAASAPFDVLVFALLFICMFFNEGVIYGGTLYSISVFHELGFTEQYASGMASAGSFGLAGGRILLAFIGPYFTPSQVLFTMLPGSFLFSCGQTILVLTDMSTKPGLGLTSFWICYMGSSVCCSCAYAWLLALYSSCQNVGGLANGMALVAINLGIMFCVNLVGQLYSHYGPKSYFLANTSLSLVGVVFVGFFHVACRRAVHRQSRASA